MRAIKIVAKAMIALIAFSGCSQKVKTIKVQPKLPHLRTCKVSSLKVRVQKKDGKVCIEDSEYKKLKRQNYRLRVCNELLNKQNVDFNRKYVK